MIYFQIILKILQFVRLRIIKSKLNTIRSFHLLINVTMQISGFIYIQISLHITEHTISN